MKPYVPSWRDQNSVIRYPFADEATLVSDDMQLRIPDDWLVDAAVYSRSAVDIPFISRIQLTILSATIWFSDSSNLLGSAKVLITGTIPAAIYDSAGRPIGTLVPGNRGHAALFTVGEGDFAFAPTAAPLVASVVMLNPFIGGMQGFQVDELTTYTDETLVLVAENGMQFTVEASQEIDSGGVARPVTLLRLHAVGDPQALSRTCDDPSRRPVRFVRELVFQYGDQTHICVPDADGNIMLLAGSPTVSDSVLRIRNRPGVVEVYMAGAALK